MVKRNTHFPFSISFSIVLLGIAVWLLWSHLGRYSEQDATEYHQLLQGDQIHSELEGHLSRQNRQGVQKDIFFDRGGQQQQLRLQSQSADLVLERREGKFAVVEQLQQAACCVQEERLFLHPDTQQEPVQKLLTLEADRAAYHYQDSLFIGEQIKLSRYLAPGHALEEGIGKGTVLASGRAAHAKYDGTEIDLEGQVVVEHPLGTLSANMMKLILPAFEQVQLDGDVQFAFKDGGVLSCAQAFLEAQNLKGTFSGNSEQPEVVYADTRRGTPLTVKSRYMSVTLAKTALESEKAPRYTLDELTADNQVVVHCKDILAGKAEHAHYKRYPEEVLTLSGRVEVDQRSHHLYNNQQVRLFQHTVDGHQQLRAIETEGDTTLTYTDGSKGRSHTVKCWGPVKVDHQAMETTLWSPTRSDGSVPEELQVCFQDTKGEIYADKVVIHYTCDKTLLETITPTQITLTGHVKIANRLPTVEGNSTVLQYLLADKVEFFPQTHEMLLTANQGNRVLFFDKVNILQVSAPALKITRDRATKKDAIQGIGDVRFSFVEYELEQLRRRFLLDKSTPKQRSD